MSLEILSVYQEGDPGLEHVLLRASATCFIGSYLLANGSVGDEFGGVNRIRQCYWFPPVEIHAGEYVSVWTKNGENTVDKMKDGTVVHRFFWNLEKPVWSVTGDCALLLDLRLLQCFRVHKR